LRAECLAVLGGAGVERDADSDAGRPGASHHWVAANGMGMRSSVICVISVIPLQPQEICRRRLRHPASRLRHRIAR
jgi:hypothetical protein